MKRSVILLLLAAFVLSAVSCAGKEEAPETGTVPGPSEAAAEEEAVVPEETERLWPDLPDKTYDGADFRFLSREVVDGFVRYYSEISSDEMNGEIMNDTVFNRTQTMETKYGIKIVDDTSGNVLGDYKNSYNAGEQNWDVIVPGYSDALTLAQSGYNADLRQIPYINTDMPWWDSSSAKSMTIGGGLFYAIGAMNTWTNSHTFAITFNKQLAADFSVDPYAMVRDNTWTLDHFKDIADKVNADIDGNGVMDEFDRYGIIGENYNFTCYMLASDVFLVENDEEGYPVLNITEKFYTAANKIYDLMSTENYFRAENYSGKYADAWTEALRANFRAGNALFHVGAICEMILYRDLDIDIGLLPMPKYDEAQQTYRHTFSNYWSSVAMVPRSSATVDFTGHLLEALQAESFYTTTQAYYDVILAGKVMRDRESCDMLDIIRETRTIDPELAYSFLGANSIYGNILSAKSIDKLASTIQSSTKKAEKSIQNLIKEYQENAGN